MHLSNIFSQNVIFFSLKLCCGSHLGFLAVNPSLAHVLNGPQFTGLRKSGKEIVNLSREE